MKSVAIVFSQAPHGSASGREGLDMLLAMSALIDQIGVFFISDGVLQLMPGQEPSHVLARDYIATFGVLELYDIHQCYVCQQALLERGLSSRQSLVLDVLPLEVQELRQRLADYDVVLNF